MDWGCVLVIRGVAISNWRNAGEETLTRLKQMSLEDPRPQVRVAALKINEPEYAGAIEQAKKQLFSVIPLYNVIGAALQYLSVNDGEAALAYAKNWKENRLTTFCSLSGRFIPDRVIRPYLPF